jgi:hypothetical protein
MGWKGKNKFLPVIEELLIEVTWLYLSLRIILCGTYGNNEMAVITLTAIRCVSHSLYVVIRPCDVRVFIKDAA